MIDRDAVFVLGAQDPEMREIERVATEAGHPVFHAASNGLRCTPQTAYEADGVARAGADGIVRAAVLRPTVPTVWVECRVAGREPLVRVDHHHPGDPGFTAPPAEYLRGSSLGQVLTLLGREPTPTQRLLAASDHCLTAAYQGECPGVDPDELLFLRASWKAFIAKRSLTEVMTGILDAARHVKQRFDHTSGEARFLDPTRVPMDLAEGAAYAGVPVRYRAWLPDGQVKEMFKGGTPEAVAAFLAAHEAAGRQVYGNPHRGYGGAYWPG